MNFQQGTVNPPTLDSDPHLATSEVRFGQILVGIDFSSESEQALATAITIGKLFGSKLFLVHAASPFVYAAGTETVPLEIFNANLEAAKERMGQLVSDKPALKELQPKVVVEYEGAIELVGQVARDQKIDLIAVGSHGAHGLERLALGSIAESILHQATCPVLIVGPNCKPEQYPFRSIIFATDLETTGLRGAQYAVALAERFHGKLIFLHVSDRNSGSSSISAEATEDHLARELQRLLPSDVDRFCQASIRLEHGKPAEVINAVALKESASLIVVGIQNRPLADHAPWSTLSHVIREARCPVLGIHGRLI